ASPPIATQGWTRPQSSALLTESVIRFRKAADTIAVLSTDQPLRIVPPTSNVPAVILRMIKGLAEYEKLSDRVTATEAVLREQLFGAKPAAEVCLAYVGDQPGGFSVFSGTFSTFACRPGIYLE